MIVYDILDDHVERGQRAKSGHTFQLRDVGNTTHHVFEARRVCFIVGDTDDFGAAPGGVADNFRERANRDLVSRADVEHLTKCGRRLHETQERLDRVFHVAETA